MTSKAVLLEEGEAGPHLLVRTAGDHSEGRKLSQDRPGRQHPGAFPWASEGRPVVVGVTGLGCRWPLRTPSIAQTGLTDRQPQPQGTQAEGTPAHGRVWPFPVSGPSWRGLTPQKLLTQAHGGRSERRDSLCPFCSEGRWPSVGFMFVFWLARADFI